MLSSAPFCGRGPSGGGARVGWGPVGGGDRAGVESVHDLPSGLVGGGVRLGGGAMAGAGPGRR